MKKIIFVLAVMLFVTSCYRDLGHYDYNFDSLNEIGEFEFEPKAFVGSQGLTVELQQPLTEARREKVRVNVKQSLAKDMENLDFRWIVRYNVTEKGKTVIHRDTLNTKGYVELELAAGKPTVYHAELKVTDNLTTLSKYTDVVIATRPIFKNSLFVLHGSQGTPTKLGNIEELGSGPVVTIDAFKTLHPESAFEPFDDVVGLTFAAYQVGRADSHNLCVFKLDGKAQLYDPFGLTPKFSPSYTLPTDADHDAPFVYDRIKLVGDITRDRAFKCLISRDGRFYVSKNLLCFYKPAGINSEVRDYRVTAATITDTYFLCWDELHKRFLVLRNDDKFPYDEKSARSVLLSNSISDAFVDLSQLPAKYSLQDKEAVYAYISYKENHSGAHPYFIFKDAEGGMYLYELTPIVQKDKEKSAGGDDSDHGSALFTISAKTLQNLPAEFDRSTMLYNSWFTPNYLFYAAGSTVYRYNTATGDNVELYTAPEGYTVSVLKFRTEESGIFVDDLGRYLSIGLNKGNDGAVAEIKLTTSGDIDATFKGTFYDSDKNGHKFSNIKDLQFAHVYLYKAPKY